MPTYNPEVGRSQVGQNIVYDDGLIFYYDMYNEYTSFKGKPTTNLLTETNGFTTWDLSSVSEETLFAVPYKKLVENAGTSSSFALLNSSVTFGLDYTMSVYAKKSERSFVQLAPSTGFSQGSYANYDLDTGTITGSFPANAASMEYIKVGKYKGWWRCQYTANSNQTTTSGRIVIALIPASTSTRLQSYASIEGYGIYLRDMQMEQSSFATPFVDGTRPADQSLIDISGVQTSITEIGTVTFNSDNTFQFVGPTNGGYWRTTTSAVGFPVTYSDPYTYEAWIKIPSGADWHDTTVNSSSGTVIVARGSYGGASGIYTNDGGSGNRFIFAMRTVNSQYIAHFDGANDQWYHLVGTYDGTTNTSNMKFYVNGNNVNNATFSNQGDAPDQDVLHIARGTILGGNYGGYITGQIPIVRAYSKALSAAEVRQNFIATRSKFGL